MIKERISVSGDLKSKVTHGICRVAGREKS